MAKLNYQKAARATRLTQQPIVNDPIEYKVEKVKKRVTPKKPDTTQRVQRLENEVKVLKKQLQELTKLVVEMSDRM